MRQLAGLIAFSILLPGLLWAQRRSPMQQQQQQTVDLQVRVVWENDHPVNSELIRVDVEAFGGGLVTSATCNSEGTARISQLPPGQYTLRVYGAGIRPATATVNLESQEGFHFEEVRVQPDATASRTSRSPSVAAVDLNIPGEARKELDKGNQEAKKQNWPQAEVHYRAAVRLYPRYAMAYNNLGVVLLATGDQAGARSAFESAVGINDHYAQAFMNLGRLLYSQGQIQPAADLLGKLVSFDPVEPEAVLLLASAELSLGKLDSAASHALSVHGLQQPACVTAGTCPTAPAPVDRYPAAHFVAGRALELSNKPGDAAAQFKLYLAEAASGPLAQQARAEEAMCEKASPQASAGPHH